MENKPDHNQPAGKDIKDTPYRFLRICMVSDDFLPAATGVGVHLQCIAKDLVRRGHFVSVITTRRKGEPEYEVYDGIRVYRTRTIRVFGFYQAIPGSSTIRDILEKDNIDILHYHYLGLLLTQAYKASIGLKIRHVYTYHMTIDHLTQPLPMKPLRGLFHRLHVKYINKFDLILAPSETLVTQIARFGIQTPARYVSNPVFFEPLTGINPEIDRSKFVVLYAGRLNPEKNIPYLLKAFKILQQKYSNTELWLVGSGSQRQALEKTCQSLGIGSSVRFMGFIKLDDLPRYYTGADVFVLPSLVETQGMVAMEAMHFAKPVIVTSSIVSAKELVDDGQNGFIVNPNEVNDLAEKLVLLYENPEIARHMGKSAQLKSKNYSPERIITQIERLYHEL